MVVLHCLLLLHSSTPATATAAYILVTIVLLLILTKQTDPNPTQETDQGSPCYPSCGVRAAATGLIAIPHRQLHVEATLLVTWAWETRVHEASAERSCMAPHLSARPFSAFSGRCVLSGRLKRRARRPILFWYACHIRICQRATYNSRALCITAAWPAYSVHKSMHCRLYCLSDCRLNCFIKPTWFPVNDI